MKAFVAASVQLTSADNRHWPSLAGTPPRLPIWKISNGLSFDFGSLNDSSHLAAVGRRANPNNPPASLHPHYQASSLLPGGPSLHLASVLCPSQFQLLG